jgi:hypothetical protein
MILISKASGVIVLSRCLGGTRGLKLKRLCLSENRVRIKAGNEKRTAIRKGAENDSRGFLVRPGAFSKYFIFV